MKNLIFVSALLFSTSLFASDCSWTDKDCVADDLDDVAEGSIAEDLVRTVTDEIREMGGEEPSGD
ncbi:MAG: hypothetical protein OQK25_01785 [Gammaproteobacteria bacterium]|nr:hypothetical protein [Gammaproteobacteria bacterium]